MQIIGAPEATLGQMFESATTRPVTLRAAVPCQCLLMTRGCFGRPDHIRGNTPLVALANVYAPPQLVFSPHVFRCFIAVNLFRPHRAEK